MNRQVRGLSEVAATPAVQLVESRRSTAAARAPGLDGIRGLAVLAVLIFHQNLSILPGGFLGVDVFFVLSGYLITDLLVGQWDANGRVALRGFWIRRARRLLPALAVMILVVTAAAAVLAPDQASTLRPALVGALSYTSNWWQALQHQSYFAAFGPPPPLQHLWSLAVEEQFYLCWPLTLIVVVRLRSRAGRAAVAWLGAAASAAAMAAIYVPGSDPSRVYYGTDTHASALLVGAALALTWPLSRLMAASPALAGRLDAAGVAGLMLLGWAMGHFAGADPAVYPAGLLLTALAAGGIVAAAAGTGVVAAMLSWQPLRWLGIRSYGVYLWHWPVIAFGAVITGPGPAGIWAHLAETALPIAIAALSWRWIEVPVMRHGVRSVLHASRHYLSGSVAAARRSPLRALPVVIPVAVITVACTAGYGVLRPAGASALQAQIAAGARISAETRAQPAIQPAGHSTAVRHSPAGHNPARHSTAGHSTARHSTARHSIARHRAGPAPARRTGPAAPPRTGPAAPPRTGPAAPPPRTAPVTPPGQRPARLPQGGARRPRGTAMSAAQQSPRSVTRSCSPPPPGCKRICRASTLMRSSAGR